MNIYETNMTARQAADRFAAEYFEEPRKVGAVEASKHAALLFKLVGGRQWYAVRFLPDYMGWQITSELSRD